MKKTIQIISILLLFSAVSFVHAKEESKVLIEDAWIAEAPPVSTVMVAYLTINNTLSNNIEIIEAESSNYSSIEFHETLHENGMARMIRHNSLSIPAHSKRILKRGGPHLMLFNPVKRLKAGDKVSIRFITKNHNTITTTVLVKKAQYNE